VFPAYDLPVSFVAVNGPTNLDQGESFTWEVFPGPGLIGLAKLEFIQTGKTYVFSVVFDMPNATGAAFAYRPGMHVYGDAGGTFTCVGCPGTSVTVPDPTLDGPTPGRGRGHVLRRRNRPFLERVPRDPVRRHLPAGAEHRTDVQFQRLLSPGRQSAHDQQCEGGERSRSSSASAAIKV
jgi:hypothetical protein